MESLSPFLSEVMTMFGLRLRQEWSLVDFSSAIIAVLLGGLLTKRVSPGLKQLRMPTGRDGESQSWAPLGTMLLGVIGQAVEPDPRMVVSAQPAQWFI